jgi:aryl-alcohol dehydrogenase-like predicted oxidoreductase
VVVVLPCVVQKSDSRVHRLLNQAHGKRDKVFLMSKVCTHGRDKTVAMQQLEESLKRLGIDHLDLWQIHEVIYENDPDLHFAKGGAVEALDEAKKQGKVRFVGFTGHKSPAIHLKMLAHDYPFDTVQMPLNCFDATYRSFEQQVLPELQRQGIAALGMKSLGGDGEPIPIWRREGGRGVALRDEPAGRDHNLRYRLAGRAASERGNCARLQTDVASRDAGAS